MRQIGLLTVSGAAVLAGGLLWVGIGPAGDGQRERADGAALVSVEMPPLSGAPARGKAAFAASCAECHGGDGGGVDGHGPPLVHRYYEPGHHGDMAFRIAVRQGARAHHWSFGNMPAIPGVDASELEDMIVYVRAVQRANGID